MNYIELINQFWQLRRSKRITNLQADLYYFLLQESSSRGIGNNWENPFQCSNGLVCTSIGITEKSLIDARNVLQQLGLIDYEKGVTKRKSPVYTLFEYWNNVSNPVSNRGGNRGGNPVSNRGGNQGYIIKGLNETETQRSKTFTGADAPEPPEPKNHIEVSQPPGSAPPPFEQFWDVYGKKVDRTKCERKWARLKATERESAMRALPEYVEATPDIQYRKNPLTWLNGKCWHDELPKKRANEGNNQSPGRVTVFDKP